MERTRFDILFNRYYDGLASAEEISELTAIVQSGNHTQELSELMRVRYEQRDHSRPYFDQATKDSMVCSILGHSNKAKVRSIFLRRVASVAAILILAVVGFYYFSRDNQNKVPGASQVAKADIAPGRAGAVLTLSDKRQISLDTAKDGLIAMDGNIRIIKENGQIRYEGVSQEVRYNEAVTGRGRSWPVNLPDGSVAWLNTSSSIRYPLSFTGKERRVEMTGECFFAVVHNDKQPFRVGIPGGITIEDVGTAFNVRSYADEPTNQTTVTEGTVNVMTKDASYMRYEVTAGRQAISAGGKLQKVIPVDKSALDAIIAWKENRFRFLNAPVQDILKEAARWYDMEVEYQDQINETFFISMSRQVPLSKLLYDMEQGGGVHFKIEGKRVIVTR